MIAHVSRIDCRAIVKMPCFALLLAMWTYNDSVNGLGPMFRCTRTSTASTARNDVTQDTILNIAVFAYWYVGVLREASAMTFSPATARVYARILARFVEYMFVYIIYVLMFLLNGMATIADISDSANGSWMVCVPFAVQHSPCACFQHLI